MRRKEYPGHYYGLQAIADATGCSQFVVRKRIIKMCFPAFKLPSTNPSGGHKYCWYTNDALINRWMQTLIVSSRDEMLRTKTARNMAVREKHIQPANQSSQAKPNGAPLGASTPDDSTHP